ncbi:MAG: class I SAM-dependent methyltransferase, partial [Verrucomicrobiota bacterium]
MNHPEPRLRLRIGATAETILRGGHPWLFAESVREQNREGKLGELAVIYDRNDKFLAVGLFDPESPLRVRVLHFGKPKTIDAIWWQNHFAETSVRRDGLFDDRTNGYRWINGESDGWPGLVLDRYDSTLVLKIYTAAWLPRLAEVKELIFAQLKPQRLVLRLSRNIQEVAREHFQVNDGIELSRDGREGETLLDSSCPSRDAIVFLENGIRFEADVWRGQKTGFFLDQRENRQRVELLSRGRDVLNAFSFSGGFSLYAARGGAKSVTDLDISAHALASARRNFSLNQNICVVKNGQPETIQADAFEWLAEKDGKKFDLIVLDPPSLAKREAERAGAIQAYGKLAAYAIARLKMKGILVAASCSAHVSAEEFFDVIRSVARKSKRAFAEIQTTRHAADHPAPVVQGDVQGP